MKDRNKPLSAIEIAKIENEVTEWVEKGVQATTDKRLVFLRAILYHACEKTKKINVGDIPYFPIRGKAVDNVRRGKFSEADFSNILEELPKYLHPLVKFLHLTGMRSGQAKAMFFLSAKTELIHNIFFVATGEVCRSPRRAHTIPRREAFHIQPPRLE